MKLPCKSYDRKKPTVAPYAHLKRDGLCMTLARGLCVSTTGENYLSQLLGWHPAAGPLRSLPEDLILAGELFVEGEDHSQVKTRINEHSERVRLEVFAICNQRYYDLPLGETSLVVEQLGLPFVPWLPGPCSMAQSLAMVDSIPPDLEGYIFKDSNLGGWVKAKRDDTIDLIVTGVLPGKVGKYWGKVGSLVCKTSEGFELCTTSGMPDNIRAIAETLVGQVVEVGYTAIGTRGRLIHPRFIRARPDKQHSQCSVDQSPELSHIWRQ